MRTCCWPKSLKKRKKKEKKSCSKSFSSHVAEVSVAVPRPAGQAPASALTLENSAWKLYLKKNTNKKRANKVKVGMNPCLLSGFFPFPSSCLQSSVTPGCWKSLQGRSNAPGAGAGRRDPLGSVSRHCSRGCLGGAAGDGPWSSQDF